MQKNKTNKRQNESMGSKYWHFRKREKKTKLEGDMVFGQKCKAQKKLDRST
jgi:hypothetical protein